MHLISDLNIRNIDKFSGRLPYNYTFAETEVPLIFHFCFGPFHLFLSIKAVTNLLILVNFNYLNFLTIFLAKEFCKFTKIPCNICTQIFELLSKDRKLLLLHRVYLICVN